MNSFLYAGWLQESGLVFFFFESYVLEGIILLPGPNLGLYFCMIMWDGIPRMTSNGPF